MGTKRKDSDRNLRIRSDLPLEDRQTLHVCSYCEGVGTKLTLSGNRYRQRPCSFCRGAGAIELQMCALVRRWMSIRNYARLAGRCEVTDAVRN